MSSILTNNAAMVALQTLKSINKNLAMTQDQISTGKTVANASDNSAVWAISKVMESDVVGFKAISDSLSLGSSTLTVAREASETVAELLKKMKTDIVSAQEDNVDRAKLQTDVESLRDQIGAVLSAAQFNGKNLVDNYDERSIMASLDRSDDGRVEASTINLTGQNLTSDAGTVETANALDRIGTVADDGTYTVGAGASLSNAANVGSLVLATDLGDTETLTINVGDQQFNYTNNTGAAIAIADLDDIVAAGITNLGVEGITAAVTGTAGALDISSTNKFEEIEISGSSTAGTTVVVDRDGAGAIAAGAAGAAVKMLARAETVSLGGTGNTGGVVTEGDGFRISIGGQSFDYTSKNGDTLNDVALGLKRVIDAGGIDGVSVKVNISEDPIASPPTILVDNDNAAAIALTVDDGSGGVASGGLVGLDGIDVSTREGAENALSNIESLIQTTIDTAAEFGSVLNRIEIQNEFVDKMTDALKSGIGSLVDADMEEVSARLQALQVQQQLGTQALSIANQAPQQILALFR